MEQTKHIITVLLLTVSMYSVSAEQYQIRPLTDYQKERRLIVGDFLNSVLESLSPQEQIVWGYQFSTWLKSNASDYELCQEDTLGTVEKLEAYIAEICGIMPWFIGRADNTLVEEIQARQFNSLCRNYQEQRKALDERQSAETLAYEAQIQKERALVRASSNRLDKLIKPEISKWFSKGKYEKQADYENRIKINGQHVFDSICSSIYKANWNKGLYYKKLDYDPEEEVYHIRLAYDDDAGNEIHHIEGICKLPPTIAKIFAETNAFRDNEYVPSLKNVEGFFYPIKYEFKLADQKYFLDFSSVEGKPVVFQARSLGVPEDYLGAYSIEANTDNYYFVAEQIIEKVDSFNSKHDVSKALKFVDALRAFYEKQGLPRVIYYSNHTHSLDLSENEFKGIPLFMDDAYRFKLLQVIDSSLLFALEKEDVAQELHQIGAKSFRVADDFYNAHFVDSAYQQYMLKYKWIDNKYKSGGKVDWYMALSPDDFKYYDDANLFVFAMKNLQKSKYDRARKYYRIWAEEFVSKHPEAQKEYAKNGSHFKDKVDFFEAYCLSENYAKALKGAKKEKNDNEKTPTSTSEAKLKKETSINEVGYVEKSTSNTTNKDAKTDAVNLSGFDEQTKVDMYYIAYLVRTQLFDTRYQKEAEKSYDMVTINQLAGAYSDKELLAMSKNKSKKVKQYRL